ncbi:hypothetical protein [Shewanella sp.]|uniref:hypothetical protein n=1 Tax=Shewanella sp. TaxID=50422 RepID=UPI003A973DF5
MPIFNKNSAADRAKLDAVFAETTKNLERYQRCKKLLDAHRPRQQIIAWLNGLNPSERERCRVILNNIKNQRRAKAEQGE